MDVTMTMDQKQLLTQQMVQTMNILQMNTLELESYINELTMENPVIELIDHNQYGEQESSRQLDIDRKLSWLESTDHQNIVYHRDDKENMNMEASWQDIRDQGESLSEYLKSQIINKKYTSIEKQIIYYIIDELTADGYFTDDINAVANSLKTTAYEVEKMLKEVQLLDPAGIGARNLSECLSIQLSKQTLDEELLKATSTIIQNYLPLVAKNHCKVIAKKMKITQELVERCGKLIRSLNPRPGNCFNDRTHFHYVSPDIIIVKFEDYFDVMINEYQYPTFQINPYYQQLANSTEDAETKDYLKEKMKQITELQDSLSYRISTLSKVAYLLVQKQMDFFLHGPGHKCPLQLSDFAEELNLHTSTISRTLNNKYLQCNWGIYPLNYFLTAAVTSDPKNEANTQEKIILKIEEIISSEDKRKPLSDQKISDILKEYNIDISRRTVAKYRGIQGIPDKSGRKAL